MKNSYSFTASSETVNSINCPLFNLLGSSQRGFNIKPTVMNMKLTSSLEKVKRDGGRAEAAGRKPLAVKYNSSLEGSERAQWPYCSHHTHPYNKVTCTETSSVFHSFLNTSSSCYIFTVLFILSTVQNTMSSY